MNGCGSNYLKAPFFNKFEKYSLIRYGPGVTKEVGFDFKNMKAKKVLLLTDKNLSGLPPVQQAMESLGPFLKLAQTYPTIIAMLWKDSFTNELR